MKFNHKLIIQLFTVVILAGSLKAFYSTANVNEVRWILAPTTYLVELATGERFTFEAYSGYMNDERSFVIAGSCSGVNFLITAFLVLTLGTLLRDGSRNVQWRYFVFAASAAFLTTIVANTVRICIALQMRRADPDLLWLNPDQIHRFEGIVVYFGFLLLLFVVSESLRAGNRSISRVSSSPLRSLLFPLVIYYSTTLGIPVANAAYRRTPLTTDFREHLFFVFLIPLVLAAILLVVKTVGNRRADSFRRMA
ncbi:hypothetical protein BH20ACI2_BH20ACI2_13910 [soil metagenome]